MVDTVSLVLLIASVMLLNASNEVQFTFPLRTSTDESNKAAGVDIIR